MFIQHAEKWKEDGNKIGTNWGLFSRGIAGRVGYQCANYYRVLLKDGIFEDEQYVKDESGNFRFVSKKGSKSSSSTTESTPKQRKFDVQSLLSEPEVSLSCDEDLAMSDADPDSEYESENESSEPTPESPITAIYDSTYEKNFSSYNLTVNDSDFDGRTSLHFAAFKGNLPLVKKLCKLQLMTTKDNFQRTPLHYAVGGGDDNLNVIEYLCTNPNSYKIKDTFGMTAVHWSIYLNRTQIRNYFNSIGITETEVPLKDISEDKKPQF